MADLEGLKVAKDYHIDTPFANQDGFYVKGCLLYTSPSPRDS